MDVPERKDTFVLQFTDMLKELNTVIRTLKKLNKGTGLSKEEMAAHKTLVSYTTYRLSDHVNRDPLIGLKVYFLFLKRFFSRKPGYQVLDQQGSILLLKANDKQRDDAIIHVERNSKEKVAIFVDKDDVRPGLNLIEGLVVLARMKLFSAGIIWRCLINDNRQRKALQILHAYEIASIIEVCKRYNLKVVHDFCGYHIESNAMAIILAKAGIRSVKSPSPGPLEIHYKDLVCDTICYSNPYQKRELSLFSDTMHFKQSQKWTPQFSHLFIDGYLDQPKTKSKTIGFYSHGEWLRRELGHSDIGRGTLESEDFILETLGELIAEHPEFLLTVYPHPMEKNEKNLSRTKTYYQDKLPGISFELIETAYRTSMNFMDVDMAIIAASTLTYERLYAGYKLLIGMPEGVDALQKGSPLDRLICDNKDTLKAAIIENADLSQQAFFEKHDLLGFRHDHF